MERELNARHTLLIEIYKLLNFLKGVCHEIFNLHFFMIRAHLDPCVIEYLAEIETDFENTVYLYQEPRWVRIMKNLRA